MLMSFTSAQNAFYLHLRDEISYPVSPRTQTLFPDMVRSILVIWKATSTKIVHAD